MPKTKADVAETMKASVLAQIDGNRQHGWGSADSTAVIMDLIAEFAPEVAASNVEVISAIEIGVKQVVNPSAFRQSLEPSKGKKGLLDESKGRVRSAERLADFSS